MKALDSGDAVHREKKCTDLVGIFVCTGRDFLTL